MDNVDLEGEQLEAFVQCVNHFTNKKDERYLVFGAFAGCGKTYTLRKVIKYLEKYSLNLAVIAFTGRAASQLSIEGITASTCHSFLFKPRFDHNGNVVGWDEKPMNEILDVCSDGIIVDESSMIPLSMHKILDRIGVPVIYAGDFGQLPPVDPSGGDFNAMTSVPGEVSTLITNHRFDVNSGIGHVAFHLRDNNSIPRIKKDGLSYARKSAVMTPVFHTENKFDIVLCGMNKTRKKINQLIRHSRGFYDDVAEAGERVVCLRNAVLSDGSRINNGELFTVMGSIPGQDATTFILKGDDGRQANVKVLNSCWEEETSPMVQGSTQLFCFGFGYCLSVHKAQGSTFNRVLFVDEDVAFFLDQKKFRYTGCTRAAQHLCVAI